MCNAVSGEATALAVGTLLPDAPRKMLHGAYHIRSVTPIRPRRRASASGRSACMARRAGEHTAPCGSCAAGTVRRA